jgi:hypothetical protein
MADDARPAKARRQDGWAMARRSQSSAPPCEISRHIVIMRTPGRQRRPNQQRPADRTQGRGTGLDDPAVDGEQLTDLATVVLGLGIFTANAAHEFGPLPGGGWRASRLGYLDEITMGYALARFSFLRGETNPPWSHYLDTNPASVMRRGAPYLASHAAPPGM